MSTVNVQWLTQDETLFELDWLSFLFSEDVRVEYEPDKIETDKNTFLICNHAVPYRYVLDRLRENNKKYVIVLLSDENLRDPCEWLHDPNCLGLMRNYISPMQLRHPKVTVFGLGYKRGFKDYIDEAKKTRDNMWCFAGTPHGERGRMLELFKQLNPNQVRTCSGFGAADGLSTKEYAEVMSDSVFALCPAGQDSMDSFRLYEALEAGCIPVTTRYSQQFKIMPSYWHGVFYGVVPELPFIIEDTWEKCLEVITKLNADEINYKKKCCINVWNQYKNKWKDDVYKFMLQLEK